MQSKTSPQRCSLKTSVKRKYKATQDSTVKKWWFVVRGDKVNLELLEKEWSKVAIQTGWKLEQAFRYDTSNTVPAQQSAEATDPVDATVITNSSTNNCQTQPAKLISSPSDSPLSQVPSPS